MRTTLRVLTAAAIVLGLAVTAPAQAVATTTVSSRGNAGLHATAAIQDRFPI